MNKYINLDCEFDGGFDAWVVEIKDTVGNVVEQVDFLDEEFEDEVDNLRKSYENKGYKVEVNIC